MNTSRPRFNGQRPTDSKNRTIADASGLSRDHVVDAMNEIVRLSDKGLCKGGKFISLPTLEKWLADEERGQLPELWGLHVLILARVTEALLLLGQGMAQYRP